MTIEKIKKKNLKKVFLKKNWIIVLKNVYLTHSEQAQVGDFL